jgi:predicted RNase H-like HicB family nuclease
VQTYTYTVVIHPADPDETGFWAEVPALPGCFTQGETIEEVIANAKDAISGFVQVLIDEGEPVPVEPPKSVQPFSAPLKVAI